MLHPRFLTRFEFDQLSTSAPTAPAPAPPTLPTICHPQIIQWSTLEVGAVFRVIDRIQIPTTPELKHYNVLQTEQQ